MGQYKIFRAFKGNISFLIDKKALFIFLALLAGAMAVFLISTGMGEMKLSPLAVLQVFFGGGSEMDRLVIHSFRLPRILVAAMAGIGLSVAGGLLQGMIRNPLASPDILGITGGAAVAVVGFLAIFSDSNHVLTVSIKWLPVAAFIGATIISVLIYVFAWNKGVSPVRLVLIGIGMMGLTKALTTLMMILGPIYQTSQANMWITGTVYGASWNNVAVIVPWILVLTAFAFIYSRNVNVQELGDEVATGLGGKVQQQRFILIMLSTGLIAGSVAFAGGIGFVGLMAPHIARRMVGSAFGALLPVSALIGGIIVMLADLAGRIVFSPLEIPAGVFTASIGAPYFIYLLFKTRNS
ncbi:iron ABC transporter permease [Bacillus sp. M6-12]|uniref:FecCD family ABC transporter permease n=1 Tax=Bacillus sp. M6-12 TaxID=2054166 RepID=UPI000C785A58|nr:iron ABC transporter permease [Bacillus sp. M6-12]PLS18054.1 iron ABC transporter permease [Bacillus sp. M6-12]